MTDLFISADRGTEVEQAAVDQVVMATMGPAIINETERLVRGGASRVGERRHLVLPVLHALQHAAGWISPGGLNYLADQLQVPPAEAYGVATFYELFRTEEPDQIGEVHHVCVDAACQIADADSVMETLKGQGRSVHASPCLGQCDRAPAVFVQGLNTPDRVPSDASPKPIPQQGDESLRLLRRIRVGYPHGLATYIERGGYQALPKAMEMGADQVLAEVETSGLSGRGGAAFPTGVKWKAVAAEDGPKHIVVNADESEPGTFKDRTLIENDPFAIIEAMTIAGFATGAEKGWIYIRGEYPQPTQRLHDALVEATASGWIGSNIQGSGWTFEIEIRRGAGAYICGEETALFNSLEGFRGEPRNKPPYPTTHGLFGRPTVVNNPETLVNVLDIITDGGEAFASVGVGRSTGTKLFCLSGKVARPGTYEVPFGATLAELIDLAGGAMGPLQAVLLGGAAGFFVGPDMLDLPLTLEATREAGVSLGSGVIMVFDTSCDMPAVVTRIAQFFRDESCGQCVPCRVGAVRQHEILQRSPAGLPSSDVGLIDEMARAMKDASICGLGHTASGAVQSAIELGLVPTVGASEKNGTQ